MTGNCHNCQSKIRGKPIRANLDTKDGIVNYCSHECRRKDLDPEEPDSDEPKDEYTKLPWE